MHNTLPSVGCIAFESSILQIDIIRQRFTSTIEDKNGGSDDYIRGFGEIIQRWYLPTLTSLLF